jgi:hypothetical protein
MKVRTIPEELAMWAYCHAICDLAVVVAGDFRRIDHVFANEFDRSVANSRGIVEQMALDRAPDIGL